jgi:hypothetical protein
LCRGLIEIAQIKKTGSKLEFTTIAKWMGRAAGEKYQKNGWVDAQGALNSEFRAATEDLIRLISEQSNEGFLDAKDLMSLLLWEEPLQAGELWGQCVEMPCISVNGKPLDLGRAYFMAQPAGEGDGAERMLQGVIPILDTPLTRIGRAVWWLGIMRDISPYLTQYRWDNQITCLVSPACQEELRIALEWIKNRDAFPCYMLDRQWKQNRALDFQPIYF